MRHRLFFKFIISYIVFSGLVFLLVTFFAPRFVNEYLINHEKNTIYKEAYMVLESYQSGDQEFRLDTTSPGALQDLKIISACMNAEAWLTDKSGNITLSSRWNSVQPLVETPFNPLDSGSNHYLVGNFYNQFQEETLSVYIPMTSGYQTSGYLIIHRPTQDVRLLADEVLGITYITTAILLVAIFLVVLSYAAQLFNPLKQIMQGAKEYAEGNFSYRIPTKAHNEMGHLAATLNDMSERLDESAENQKKFLANVSHDFRSPLTSIHGYAEAIADGTIPPELQGKYLKIIVNETNRLTKLTQDMLELHTYDANGSLVNYAAFSINDIIRQCAAMFEGICRPRHISFSLTFEEQDLMVWAVEAKIQQVVYNLIDNAIKFSPDGSSIDIETYEMNGKAVISIKDSGVGISKEHIRKIWDRFYKIDASRGKDKKGTGLGLSIVKEILKAHGENIDVVSTEGAGTKFTFQLALAEEE